MTSQSALDEHFEVLVDLQKEEEVLAILQNMKISSPSKKSLEYAFKASCATRNERILSALGTASNSISSSSSSTSRSCLSSSLIDEVFSRYVEEGIWPPIIEVLQFHLASPKAVTEQQRRSVQLRKHHISNQRNGHYLVMDSEREKIVEAKKRVSVQRYDQMSRKRMIQARLRNRIWFSDEFEIAVRYNAKLLVFRLLESQDSRPHVDLIDQAFSTSLVYRANLSMAEILMPYISQRGFDEAFTLLTELMVDLLPTERAYHDEETTIVILQYLLSGRGGFVIDQGTLNQAYVDLVNRYRSRSMLSLTVFTIISIPFSTNYTHQSQ